MYGLKPVPTFPCPRKSLVDAAYFGTAEALRQRSLATSGKTHPEVYWEVVGVEGMFFEARAVANSTVLAGPPMSVSGRLLP
jgi:hypothetical protein